MKRQMRILVFTLLLFTISHPVSAQEKITIVTPDTEVAKGLDLNAVTEIFKDSKNLEDFEEALNDPEIGINNLDLNKDGYVDYIRVVEQVTNNTHLIILQVPLGDNEFQDVATIEIEKAGNDYYNMQVRGNEAFYGVNYYVSPRYIRIYNWPIITWIYRPFYRPYRSIFYFGYYPRWWTPHRSVAVPVYHSRTERHARRAAFYENRIRRTPNVHEGNHKRHSDYGREKQIDRGYPAPEPDRSNNYTKPPARREERASMDRRERTQNDRTIRSETNRTFKSKQMQHAPFKRELRKPTKSAGNKITTAERGVNQPSRLKVEKRSDVHRGDKKTTINE